MAAVSYYVVGLIGYVFKALKEAGRLPVDPNLATGLSVPLVLLLVYAVVRRIRASHADEDASKS